MSDKDKTFVAVFQSAHGVYFAFELCDLDTASIKKRLGTYLQQSSVVSRYWDASEMCCGAAGLWEVNHWAEMPTSFYARLSVLERKKACFA